MRDYKAHEFTRRIPEIDEKDYLELKRDIQTHGLYLPIIIYAGQILDGRARYRACRELGIQVKVAQFMTVGKDPLTFVKSMNIRRHVSKGLFRRKQTQIVPDIPQAIPCPPEPSSVKRNQETIDIDQYLTAGMIEKSFSIVYNTLQRHAKKGTIKTKKVGKKTLYCVTDVEKLKNKHEQS